MNSKKLKVKKVKKIDKLKYLNGYEIEYTGNNKEKKWELVSRAGLERLENEIFNNKSYSDGVMIFATNKLKDKVVLLKEYRVSAGRYLYTLPAGLCDGLEDIEISAKREFKEETGMEFKCEYLEKERYTSVGIINEKVSIAYGYYSGFPSKEYQEDSEDAEIEIVDKTKAKEILKNHEVTIRSALILENFFKLNKFIND